MTTEGSLGRLSALWSRRRRSATTRRAAATQAIPKAQNPMALVAMWTGVTKVSQATLELAGIGETLLTTVASTTSANGATESTGSPGRYK